MEVKIYISEEPIWSTSSKPNITKLTLTAKGTYAEIEWYKKQLNKIGKKK